MNESDPTGTKMFTEANDQVREMTREGLRKSAVPQTNTGAEPSFPKTPGLEDSSSTERFASSKMFTEANGQVSKMSRERLQKSTVPQTNTGAGPSHEDPRPKSFTMNLSKNLRNS